MPETVDPDETVVPEGFAETEAPELLVGRYEIGGLLGRGAAGQVHRAHDRLSGNAVAVKFIRPTTPGAARQLHRELVALRLLDLPGVVRLLDDGVVEGQAFLVMPLLDGGRFDTVAVGAWHLWREQAFAVLEALGRVHFLGLVHGDLKPGNILLDSKGRPHLADFGLAAGLAVVSEEDGVRAGTPRYMAPELKRGSPPDARTDLYAMGVMFRELVRDAPAEVAEVLASMCAEDPEDRPASVEVVLSRLGQHSGNLFGAVELPEHSDVGTLGGLFADTDPSFLHLAEDAAEVLFRRTAGERGAVRAELERWVRLGLCHWEGDVAVVDRRGVDVLRASQGPNPWTLDLEGARQARAAGDTARSLAILESLAGANLPEVAASVVDLLLSQWRPIALKRGVYLAERHGWGDALSLLRAATVVMDHEPERGLALLRGLRLEAALEGWRLGVAILAAGRLKEPVQEWLELADVWAGAIPARVARVATWRARVAYVEGRFAEALALERIGLAGADTPQSRLARLTTASAAALEVPATEAAAGWALEAIDLGRLLRVPAQELRGVWLSRTVALRTGRPMRASPALVDAAEAVSPALAAQLALTEAASAWRLGDLALAKQLGIRAAGLFSRVARPDGHALAKALAFLCGASQAPTEQEARDTSPEVGLQVLGLSAMAGQALNVPVRVDWAKVRSRWLDVLTGDECYAVLRQRQ